MINLTRRQQEIVTAALKLISEGGIQDLTMKNLAKSLGVTEPALYRHFKNKHEILSRVLSFLGENMREIFRRATELPLDPLERIRRVFQRHFEVFEKNPALAVILFSEGLFQLEGSLLEQVKGIMEYSRKRFVAFIEEGQSSGTIRADIPSCQLALILMGTLRLHVLRWKLNLFSFNLKEEGDLLWSSLEKILKATE